MSAEKLLRLYPRAWRKRYEDELRALLADTTVTPAVMLDLVAGALREWARVAARQPATPVSLTREIWRDLARSIGGTIAMLGLTWVLAMGMTRAGIGISRGTGALPLVQFTVVSRVGSVYFRRYWTHYRATLAAQGVSPEALAAFGLGRFEYWTWIAIIAAASTVAWLGGEYPVGALWLWLLLDWLLGATKPELSRRARIQQLALARHQSRHGGVAPAGANPMPWL